jgi:hypothetical protein
MQACTAASVSVLISSAQTDSSRRTKKCSTQLKHHPVMFVALLQAALQLPSQHHQPLQHSVAGEATTRQAGQEGVAAAAAEAAAAAARVRSSLGGCARLLAFE